MINTRFNINDEVFIYQKGKLIKINVAEIKAQVSQINFQVQYGFLFSKQPDAAITWITENEVFKTKEEILER